jgi:hypothetical protein
MGGKSRKTGSVSKKLIDRIKSKIPKSSNQESQKWGIFKEGVKK